MIIYATRHGLTEFNKKNFLNGQIDDKLAPEGIEQIKLASLSIPKTIQHIYSSSLQRARQTAEILNEHIHAKISFYDELKEVNFGIHQGRLYADDVKKKHRSQNYDWHSVGGESIDDVKSRVIKILKEIKINNKDGEALIVAHGGIIRLLYFLEKGVPVGEIDNVSLHSFNLDKILSNS